MVKEYALRIYKDKDLLLTVVTTRTGLVYDEQTGKVSTDLKKYNGKEYVLYNITEHCEVGRGTITENLICKKAEKKNDGPEKVSDK